MKYFTLLEMYSKLDYSRPTAQYRNNVLNFSLVLLAGLAMLIFTRDLLGLGILYSKNLSILSDRN